nr:MAG TPA: Head Tail Connector Protein [Caudoviricetes sp.]
MYVNYGYYESKYLLGREPTVPEDDFLFWEKQTERVLNQHTFGRLTTDTELLTDEVKDCACELAELLYQADKSAQQAAVQGGVLQSYSNDGESGTFDLSHSTFTEEGKAKKIREIIHRYLGNTGLLYRGE